MRTWGNIIQTALLGTHKKEVAACDMPVEIQEAVNIISGNGSLDPEEKFLQVAALSFNFRQSGMVKQMLILFRPQLTAILPESYFDLNMLHPICRP